MKIDNPVRIALLSLVALAVWFYNFGQFQARAKDEALPQKVDASWDIQMDERLKILAQQQVPEFPTLNVNPFFPNLKPQPEVEAPPEVAPPPMAPPFPITYVGMVSGHDRQTLLLEVNGVLTFAYKGDVLADWELSDIQPEKVVFISGEFSQELAR
ncbi:MAG: hypothetical protein H6510_16700 [Acidobacteria bacterium]|nr:hypothetical protein [Acidobacteriota bacterium]MCB9399455.1 hypothetical protein [Acidobacteriota bacterium]